MRVNITSVLLLISLLLASCVQSQARCNSRQLRSLRVRMLTKVVREPRVGALWLRAAFHDCITATRSNPNSGCNGSIRFDEELNVADNNRLRPAIEELRPFVEGQCINWADGLMLAVEATMIATRGPSVRLVSVSRPREEATRPDTVEGNIPNVLGSYSELKEHYRLRGLSENDLIVSNVGGHAIGGFVPPGGSTVLPFTPTDNRVDNVYAKNLVGRIRRGSSALGPNSAGFNTLPSDDVLVSDRRGRRFLAIYGRSDRVFQYFFRNFLVKMSRISDRTVSV